MNILIAPDKFKGSLNAAGVCRAVEEGIRRVHPTANITKQPLADGGEGSLSILMDTLGLEEVNVDVNDPLFRPISASYGILGRNAYIEMARASGLELLAEEERTAMDSSTLGTGELLQHAIERGAERIFLFVGGSATTDGGMGLATALGYQFQDKEGETLLPVGRSLPFVDQIIFPKQGSTRKWKLHLVTDVRNKLFGKDGAALVFGKQKGASADEITLLDGGLRNLSERLRGLTGGDVAKIPGVGAAGALGACAVGLFNASLALGVDTLFREVGFDQKLENVDLIITGEGKLDSQTFGGKVVDGVLQRTKKRGIPSLVVCGVSTIEESHELLSHSHILPLKRDQLTTEFCIENAYELIVERIAEEMKKWS